MRSDVTLKQGNYMSIKMIANGKARERVDEPPSVQR
jgi:hypothetical protein